MKRKIISLVLCLLLTVTIIPIAKSQNHNWIISTITDNRNGTCDLTITSVFYTPNPPLYGRDIFFHMTIVDRLGHITNGLVDVQTTIEEWPFDVPQTIEMYNGTAILDFYFTWYMSGTYSIKFVITPNDYSINETNWNDNTYILSNLSAVFTPAFLMGSTDDVYEFGDGWYVKANQVFYILFPFKIGFFSNDTIYMPIKYLGSGYIRNHGIIFGIFKIAPPY